MKQKIVKLNITDYEMIGDMECPDGVLLTYYLINPDEGKLKELKDIIEGRFYVDGLTDEEIEAKEELCDDIWGYITDFIDENFVTLDIDKTYVIAY